MKKAEAISILATSVRPREAKDRERYDKAVNMAIEALKSQDDSKESSPTHKALDTISRADAIDALMEILDRPHHAEFLYTDEICRALNGLPSVQPVDKDINVSCKDVISRQDAIDAVDKLSDKPIGYLESAIDVLVDLPSVQPDIIVCADCKHWVCHDKRCGYWNHGVQPMMWCSQAERRWKE